MRTTVLALILAARVAVAQPAGAVDLAVRAGGASSDYGWGGHSEAGGRGPLIDAEVGWTDAWWSIAGVVSYISLGEVGSVYDVLPRQTFDLRVRAVDVGVRASLHGWGAFAGIGLADEIADERGAYTTFEGGIPTPPPTMMRLDSGWGHNRMFEIHAGYTLPRIAACRCAAEVIAVYTTASLDFGPNADQIDLSTMRLAFGVRF